jgi:hypothetical protein
MVARTAVLAGLVVLTGLALETAPAQDFAANGTSSGYALNGIMLTEPDDGRNGLELSWRTDPARRFADAAPTRFSDPSLSDRERREIELTFAAPNSAPFGLDVALAQRAAFAISEDGEIGGAAAGAELRVGRNLSRVARPWQQSDQGSWYMFIASDGQALTWSAENAIPGQRGLRLQDRVTIGDTQIGVTYEFRGLQASLAYTQREVSYNRITSRGYTEDESFAGFVLTYKR